MNNIILKINGAQHVIKAAGTKAANKNGNEKGTAKIGKIPIKYKNKSKYPTTPSLLDLGESNFKYDEKMLSIFSF